MTFSFYFIFANFPTKITFEAGAKFDYKWGFFCAVAINKQPQFLEFLNQHMNTGYKADFQLSIVSERDYCFLNKEAPGCLPMTSDPPNLQ